MRSLNSRDLYMRDCPGSGLATRRRGGARWGGNGPGLCHLCLARCSAAQRAPWGRHICSPFFVRHPVPIVPCAQRQAPPTAQGRPGAHESIACPPLRGAPPLPPLPGSVGFLTHVCCSGSCSCAGLARRTPWKSPELRPLFRPCRCSQAPGARRSGVVARAEPLSRRHAASLISAAVSAAVLNVRPAHAGFFDGGKQDQVSWVGGWWWQAGPGWLGGWTEPSRTR